MGLSVLAWIKLAAFAALAIAVGLFYWHYQDLVAKKDQLELDKQSLERTAEAQKLRLEAADATVKRWEAADAERVQEIARLKKSQLEARDYARRLDKFFGSVDLREAARDDRAALQLRLNGVTADALRLWECASGGGVACPVAGAAEVPTPAAP